MGGLERRRHDTGQPIGGAAPYVVKTFGALKVGFIGLCLNTPEITGDKLKHTRIIDPLTAAGRRTCRC